MVAANQNGELPVQSWARFLSIFACHVLSVMSTQFLSLWNQLPFFFFFYFPQHATEAIQWKWPSLCSVPFIGPPELFCASHWQENIYINLQKRVSEACWEPQSHWSHWTKQNNCYRPSHANVGCTQMLALTASSLENNDTGERLLNWLPPHLGSLQRSLVLAGC